MMKINVCERIVSSWPSGELIEVYVGEVSQVGVEGSGTISIPNFEHLMKESRLKVEV